ncbi:MAG TPA: hypothetical protein PK156_49825 [Polyangium sp.]|nr:hypothetical protein [Polyangium sp.]
MSIRHGAIPFGLILVGMGLANATGCLALSTTTPDGMGGAAGAGGSGSTGEMAASSSSSSGGGNKSCNSNNDCDESGSSCKTVSCVSGMCVTSDRSEGYPCNNNTRVCDGMGSCVDCVSDSDCDGSGAICDNNDCISCSDGDRNGDETGVDCGGSRCAPCTGATCATQADCMVGTCVDGYCCDSPCDQACKACNLAGKLGKCSSLSSGTEDPGVCEGTKACNGFGAQCLLKNGQPCTADGECISDFCGAAICQP